MTEQLDHSAGDHGGMYRAAHQPSADSLKRELMPPRGYTESTLLRMQCSMLWLRC
jgi:hypothetical protein